MYHKYYPHKLPWEWELAAEIDLQIILHTHKILQVYWIKDKKKLYVWKS
jgi:hypothetical protein